MRGCEALVESLKREGVRHIFGIPGGAIIETYDVLYSTEEIRHILVRHEQCAAHAADGYARASGEVGVCMATSGPGATNLVTGIANAYMDSIPIVAITGQVPTYLVGNDAFQEADILGITMPITKHNFQLRDPEDIPSTVRAAFLIAKTRRPGPVLIDVPRDVQQAELKSFKYPSKLELPGYKPKAEGGHPLQLKAAAEAFVEAERPVILAGGGVITSNASMELAELAELLLVPVTTTLLGKGSFPEDHPLALGMAGMHGRKCANKYLTECDLLLAVGTRFSDRTTGKVEYFAPEAKVIHVDIDPAEIGKNVRVDIPIVGDAKLVLKNLLELIRQLGPKPKTAWAERLRQLKEEFSLRYNYEDVPIKPQRVMMELNKILNERIIITTEVGQCQMWAAHYLSISKPRQFISAGGLGTMGFGFPAAMGTKVAKPECEVIDVASEGSFLMTSQDLATCVMEDIKVIVLILNNRYLGMVKQWQDLFFGKRRSQTYLGEVPEFVKYAEAFKAKGILVERPSEIRTALEEALRSDLPCVIDVRVDPDAYVLPMVRPGGRIDEMIERL